MKTTPIVVRSHRNNSPLSGWLALALALLCGVVGWFNGGSSWEPWVLWGLAAMFVAVGVGVLIWSAQRIVTFCSERQEVQIEDSSRFKKSSRALSFASVLELTVQQWEDPDPDIRPVKRVLYCVGIRLRSGELIEITDWKAGQDHAEHLRAALARCVKQA